MERAKRANIFRLPVYITSGAWMPNRPRAFAIACLAAMTIPRRASRTFGSAWITGHLS